MHDTRDFPLIKTTAIATALLTALLLTPGCGDESTGGRGGKSTGRSDHSNEHGNGEHDNAEHGPHDGTVAALEGEAGFVELKLHDDKGDLELWLAADEKIETPMDLPLDSKLEVKFLDHEGRVVTLRVRNKKRNEDEDGKANVRGDGTNYFIFPGDSGADASWLKGEDFESRVEVGFTFEGMSVTTKSFLLRPHTHGGHDHEHD
jgi:hypothetical protein